MFNFLTFIFFIYYFYKNNIKTGKLKQFIRRTLPNVVCYLQNIVDNMEGRNRKYQREKFSNGSNYMSVEEAMQILGLRGNPSKEEILIAFKKLMLVNHPDKGGTEYLASKIIQAKQILTKN